MSVRTPHRTRSAVVTVAAAVVLVGATGSVAAADPPSLNRDPCVTSLAKLTVWPGTMTVDDREVRLVSDAFASYLGRQAECEPRS
jgi:hypothetical protein